MPAKHCPGGWLERQGKLSNVGPVGPLTPALSQGARGRRRWHASEHDWQLLTGRGAQRHLEAGATAFTRHTAHITAVVAGNLADQGEAQADATITTLTHAARTVEGGKDPFSLLFWHPGPTIGNAQA